MRLRRCAVLVIEPREEIHFDAASLFDGGDGLRAELTLLALAPHLPCEIPIKTAHVDVLASLPTTAWTERRVLDARHSPALVDELVALGLVIADDRAHTALRERDDRVRETNWRPLAAAAHYFGRWREVRSGDEAQRAGLATMRDMVEKLGEPPPPVHERAAPAARIALPAGEPGTFDDLLQRRATCRNFDVQPLPALQFATMLQRVFGAQGRVALGRDNAVIKRNSPSGGGLHPIEAYLIVQRVEGVAPGLYHYHPIDHALEPMRSLETEALADLALRSVAAQAYFAAAPVLVVLACRFARSFWKYRNHAKAYRVVTLDAGHLSQTLYLSATDLRLGAFITGAVNEIEIEEAFGLDPLVESVLAVCGFGARSDTRETNEFDPARRVWDADGRRIKA